MDRKSIKIIATQNFSVDEGFIEKMNWQGEMIFLNWNFVGRRVKYTTRDSVGSDDSGVSYQQEVKHVKKSFFLPISLNFLGNKINDFTLFMVYSWRKICSQSIGSRQFFENFEILEVFFLIFEKFCLLPFFITIGDFPCWKSDNTLFAP
jgi:hypothetical protein